MTTPLNIGQTPQLFFDNYVIEMVQAMTRRAHRPEKSDHNPVVKQDRPWEVTPYFRTGSMGVAFDTLEKLYKCWYMDFAWDYERFMGRGGSHQGLVPPELFETTDMRWLYAESDDGIEWRKPELDYREIDGRKTNICLGREDYAQMYVGAFFLDALETDPAERFKAVHWRHVAGEKGLARDQISVAHSGDGRDWTTDERTVVVGLNTERRLGDEIMIFPDCSRGQYIVNGREMAMGETLDGKDIPCREEKNWEPPYYPGEALLMNKRRVFVTTSNSLWEMPSLQEVMVPDDAQDNIDDEFYSLPMVRIGDMYIGFLNVLHTTDNTMNVRLLYSRDAFNWSDVDRGRPFLEVGSAEEGAWDPYLVEVSNSVILADDGIRIYYGGSACHHDWWMFGEKEGLDMPDDPGVCKTALGLATLRPEGFVSMNTTVRPGVLLTRPFVSDGDHLVVNVACGPKGYLDVELTDASDKVIEGCGRGDHDTFTGDSVRHTVTWRGKSQLPRDVLARGAKLRFWSRDCGLYSFRIAAKTNDSGRKFQR